jgi:hypothetical protein
MAIRLATKEEAEVIKQQQGIGVAVTDTVYVEVEEVLRPVVMQQVDSEIELLEQQISESQKRLYVLMAKKEEFDKAKKEAEKITEEPIAVEPIKEEINT